MKRPAKAGRFYIYLPAAWLCLLGLQEQAPEQQADEGIDSQE